MRKLIIVESPVKAKHISHMLGREYIVVPTRGHLKDLPKNELGIDVNKGFQPKWTTIRGKAEIIRGIIATSIDCDQIIIATDPDREGEGIAHHIFSLLSKEQQKKVRRAEFREITKSGIQEGLSSMRDVDHAKAMAQQARRLVDRLVGFQVSPMLWKKVKGKPGLSAGRVQSAALKVIYDRHAEINEFTSEDYWTISGIFGNTQGTVFSTVLTHLNDISIKERPIRIASEVDHVKGRLEGMEYFVRESCVEDKSYWPPDPFITTTLMQAASNQLNFPSKKTMSIAQELFESGLITYMRTDSIRVSQEIVDQTHAFISERWGESYIPKTARIKDNTANAQDAHECIRPTDIRKTANLLEDLTTDQNKLYELIYNQFVKSQMAAAIHREKTVKIHGFDQKRTATFHGFSSKVIFLGWRVLQEVNVNLIQGIEELHDEEPIKVMDFESDKHSTRPPSPFTEAKLIEKLERLGIGRPSTYASIIDTLLTKKYVTSVGSRLLITDLGILVIEALEGLFPKILDVGFTANMEQSLDSIANGEIQWESVVQSLHDDIHEAQRNSA